MKKFKLGRLNRKGFTLIELLAVIVILAIVMGIAATSVLNSINNSRKSSLHSAAQSYASNINTWAAEDALVQTDNNRKLGDTFEKLIKVTNKNKWVCLSTLSNNAETVKIKNGGTETTLINALGISTSDVKVTGSIPENPYTGNKAITTASTCSAIRYNVNSAAYEILLVAVNGGKYYVTTEGNNNYAFSRATSYATLITD